jgi:putative membrane protein
VKTGADFDTAYAADQVAAHQATLDALKSYSTSGDVPALKTFATGLIPTVTAHLNMAKGLKP